MRSLWIIVPHLVVTVTVAFGQDDETTVSKLEKTLFSHVQLEFAETPLSDVAEYLQDLVDVPVVLDRRGLAKAELDGRVPISFRGAVDAPLYLSLNRMLHPLGLGWVMEGEAILLTTGEVAATRLTTRTYYVGDLGWWGGAQEIAVIISKTIEPASWSTRGGKGSIRVAGLQVVVTQNQPAHQKIMQLLRDARRRRSD